MAHVYITLCTKHIVNTGLSGSGVWRFLSSSHVFVILVKVEVKRIFFKVFPLSFNSSILFCLQIAAKCFTEMWPHRVCVVNALALQW